MNKYYGNIGIAATVDKGLGVWSNEVVEKTYSGDIIDPMTYKYESSGGVNENLNITQKISILMDKFISDNFSGIKYVEYMGAKWKVISAVPQYPRITLTIGGLYND